VLFRSAGTVKLLASSASTTNVQTISFGSTGLTPSTATSGAVTVAGTLAVANGGTGIVSFGTGVAGALGQNVSGSGNIALTTSPVFTTPNLGTPSAGTLTSCTGLPLTTGITGTLAIGNGGTGSTSTTYCSLTTNVTGTLPVANGGTGVASATAYALLAGGTTTTGPFQSIASVGTAGQVLTSNGAGALPTFQAASGGVTTISFGSTGLTPSTATSGAVSVAGTLAVANGGTGQTSYTDGQLLIGNTTGNTLAKATLTGTSNQVVVTNGSGSITLSTPQSIGTASSVQFGSFGVGTAASGTSGEIRATNNVTAYYSSDIRLKSNINDISNALDKVNHIGGKTFDWSDNYIAEHGGEDGYFVQKSDFGVIAQDVQEVFPQAVRTREDGTLAVDYAKLSALAFAAIKELSEKVKILEAK
jgi:hypothetical protein